MTRLTSIMLSKNQFTGTIPSMTSLVNLVSLAVDQNKLTGCFSEPRGTNFVSCTTGGPGNSVCVCNRRICENDTAINCGPCSGISTCPTALGAPAMKIVETGFAPYPDIATCSAPTAQIGLLIGSATRFGEERPESSAAIALPALCLVAFTIAVHLL